jgi:4-diphosphocytidyl-2-C-methyl-D-erythritol kinase
MPTRVRSFSKINLGLAVGPTLPGTPFHALTTCYQTLAAHDLVTVSARPASTTTITLTANHPGVPRTEAGNAEKNTAYRLVELALKALNLNAEVHIDLDKRMPVQGGLGAGSANAAAALIALEKELAQAFQTAPLPADQRLALAAEVGSDIPLFLLGGTVLGLHRGEQVSELPDLPEMPCVLALPNVGVSTALAFRDLDAEMAEDLQNPASVDKLNKLSHALSHAFGQGSTEPGLSGITSRSGDLAENPLLTLVRTGIENDFEEVVFSQHPTLRSTKRILTGSGPDQALFAGLSGSGSALFGLYATEADAFAAQQRVQASGTRVIVTSTIARPRYWHTMFAE